MATKSKKKTVSYEAYKQLETKVSELTEELIATRTQLENQGRDIQRLKAKFNAMEECGVFNKRKYYMGVLFSFIDTDLSGFIDLNELTLFLSSLKARDVHHRLVAKIVKKYDVDLNHKLDPEEFETFLTAILHMSFEKLDSDKTGQLTLSDCEKLVDVALGENKEEKDRNPDEQAQTAFAIVDTDKSGFIDKDEFVDFVIERIVRAQQLVGKGTIFMAEAIGKIVKFNQSDFRELAGEPSMAERLKKVNQELNQEDDSEKSSSKVTIQTKSKTVLFVDPKESKDDN